MVRIDGTPIYMIWRPSARPPRDRARWPWRPRARARARRPARLPRPFPIPAARPPSGAPVAGTCAPDPDAAPRLRDPILAPHTRTPRGEWTATRWPVRALAMRGVPYRNGAPIRGFDCSVSRSTSSRIRPVDCRAKSAKQYRVGNRSKRRISRRGDICSSQQTTRDRRTWRSPSAAINS